MASVVAFSPEGTKLLTGHGDFKARLWDLTRSHEPVELQHDGPIVAADFSPDGKTFVTGAYDGSARVWDATGRLVVPTLRRFHMFTSTVGNTPGQIAAAAALRGPQDCVEKMLAEYRKRRDRIVELVEQTPHLTGYRPGGAFYIMPSFPRGADSSELTMRILKETGVCAIPGDTFGESSRNAMRISYATALEKMRQQNARAIVIVDDQGTPTGVVKRDDIVSRLLEKLATPDK